MIDPLPGQRPRRPIVAGTPSRRISRSRLAAGTRPLALALALGIVLNACGSSAQKLDTARVETAVAASILAQRGLHTTVSCPSGIPVKTGYSFTCNAALDVGSYPVTVVVTNSKGHVRYENRAPLVALNSEKIEQAIAASIARQRHLSSTVTCPQEILQKAGLSFTCTAVVKGSPKHYPFDVTQVDNDGHVRYVGR
jgi:Domain of unknown function (DUF4333)